jgi:DNA-binding MarR family transcriptional regulator
MRPTEVQYRAEQRRLTRACGLLGDSIFGLPISTSVWQVLSEVVLAQSPPSVGELASLLSVAQNSLSSAATNLVNRKLISRESCTKDKRTVLLRPTSAGKRLYSKIESHAETMFIQALKNEDKQKIQSAVSIFQKFLGDSGEGIAPLADSYEVQPANEVKAKCDCRGLIARSYVRDGRECSIPEVVASAANKTWMLKYEQKIVAVIDVDQEGKQITSSGWEEDVSGWILQSFLHQLYRMNGIESSCAEHLERSCKYLYEKLR